MILGLLTPDAGHIELFGEIQNRNKPSFLSRIGALIERPDFYLYLSAYRNLELMMRYSGLTPNQAQIMNILEWVGLAERAKSAVKTFSHGMKQRLGIAQTLLHEPDLIILDEPVNGLDPQGIKDIRDLILRLNRDLGKTLIISSHILREMELIANRMVVINRGEVVVEGEVKKLLSEGSQRVILVCDQAEAALKLLSSHFPDHRFELNTLGEIHSFAATPVVVEFNRLLVQNNFQVRQLATQNSLEDYFLNIT